MAEDIPEAAGAPKPGAPKPEAPKVGAAGADVEGAPKLNLNGADLFSVSLAFDAEVAGVLPVPPNTLAVPPPNVADPPLLKGLEPEPNPPKVGCVCVAG